MTRDNQKQQKNAMTGDLGCFHKITLSIDIDLTYFFLPGFPLVGKFRYDVKPFKWRLMCPICKQIKRLFNTSYDTEYTGWKAATSPLGLFEKKGKRALRVKKYEGHFMCPLYMLHIIF